MSDGIVEVLDEAQHGVAAALGRLEVWNEPGTRRDQFACDLAADEAAFGVLDAAGFGVVSEERSPSGLDRDIVVVVDPVDGTANAVRGIPYFATSLCAIDADGMLAALVVNLATGTRFEAIRGQGARCDGNPIQVTTCNSLADATVALCGFPRPSKPWRHMRAFGATALELCDVARGQLDAYVNTEDDTISPWDYLGGLLVCLEAGAAAADGKGRPLLAYEDGRTPQVAATPQLLRQVVAYAWPRIPE